MLVISTGTYSQETLRIRNGQQVRAPVARNGRLGVTKRWRQAAAACAHEAAVSVVDEEIRPECSRAEVVDAAGAVGDVPHHDAIFHARKRFENVSEGAGVQ